LTLVENLSVPLYKDQSVNIYYLVHFSKKKEEKKKKLNAEIRKDQKKS